MQKTPLARLDEPISGRVEAVYQQQKNWPDKKIAQDQKKYGHDEVAAAETPADLRCSRTVQKSTGLHDVRH
jgi:hypothetical protein